MSLMVGSGIAQQRRSRIQMQRNIVQASALSLPVQGLMMIKSIWLKRTRSRWSGLAPNVTNLRVAATRNVRRRRCGIWSTVIGIQASQIAMVATCHRETAQEVTVPVPLMPTVGLITVARTPTTFVAKLKLVIPSMFRIYRSTTASIQWIIPRNTWQCKASPIGYYVRL